MNAFLVDLENKPGKLADIAEALGAKGVNITNVTGATCGDGGRAAITTADDATTLGKAARRLAQAGVNIDAIFPTGMTGNDVSVGFVTNNPAKAREVLMTVGATR